VLQKHGLKKNKEREGERERRRRRRQSSLNPETHTFLIFTG